jgi:galactokinase
MSIQNINRSVKKSIDKFFKTDNPGVLFESPGRINLIGEHSDYNHGFAMPTAIEKKDLF